MTSNERHKYTSMFPLSLVDLKEDLEENILNRKRPNSLIKLFHYDPTS